MNLTPEWIRANLIGAGFSIKTPFGVRRITYADYVASGRALEFVEKRLLESVLPFYANTHTEDSYTGAHTTQLAHEAGEYIKAQLGAPEYKIVFCGSGSTATIKRMQEILGLVAPSTLKARLLEVMRPEERPVVFVGPYEHHSNEVSWRESLAEVIEIPLCPKGLVNLDALHAALTDKRFVNRPKIGSFSAASNVTGILSDTRSIARLLHAHGAFAFFDFAASAPYVKIDMHPNQPDGYDAVFISPHKMVGGIGSPGILVFNPVLYNLTTPSTAGGGTVTYVTSSTHDFTSDIEAREDAGTPAIVQKMRAAYGFWVKEKFGIENIERLEKNLIQNAIARLQKHPNIELLGNLEAPRLAVLSFLVRSDGGYLHPRFVVRLLNDLFGIQSRGGCACAGPYGHQLLGVTPAAAEAYRSVVKAGFEGIKLGWTRLNFNYFISRDEFEFLLQAVEFVASYGQRFIGSYDFNWQTGAWKHRDAPSEHASLFDLNPPPEPDTAAVPYERYLLEANALAQSLQPRFEREIPDAVPRELVSFRIA
ncbi:MAG: aminotransferase class V-fold PLP-dependent enzyme [Deinococcales bacterium]